MVPLRVGGNLRSGYCRGPVVRLRRLGRAGGFPSWLLVEWNPGTILQGSQCSLICSSKAFGSTVPLLVRFLQVVFRNC
jgi:hypothetical protein